MLEYYIIDTETTGLNGRFHEMTEISIIRAADRCQLTRQIKCLHPERADAKALQVTGRSIADIMKGENKKDVVALCNDFFHKDGKTPDHRCIVAHNCNFDKRFLHALWEEVGEIFPANNWLDTIKLSRNWAKKIGRAPDDYKLGTLLKFAEIKAVPGLHTASADSRNTYLLWKKEMDLGIDYLSATIREPHVI